MQNLGIGRNAGRTSGRRYTPNGGGRLAGGDGDRYLDNIETKRVWFYSEQREVRIDGAPHYALLSIQMFNASVGATLLSVNQTIFIQVLVRTTWERAATAMPLPPKGGSSRSGTVHSRSPDDADDE